MLLLLTIFVISILAIMTVVFIVLTLALIFPSITEHTFLENLLDDDN